MAWVALGKSLPEFVYFAVEICRGPLPSATPGFSFWKKSAKHQGRRVVLGWGMQIFEKSSQTVGITAATVSACQRYNKNDTHGKFNSHDPGDKVLTQEFFGEVDFFLRSWPLLKLSNIACPLFFQQGKTTNCCGLSQRG